MARYEAASLRAAWWALRALRVARRAAGSGAAIRGGDHVPRPPVLPECAVGGVLAVLNRRPTTCLARALVLQRWYASHGRLHDVVIGVRGPTLELEAHAWLDGEESAGEGYTELLRRPPP